MVSCAENTGTRILLVGLNGQLVARLVSSAGAIGPQLTELALVGEMTNHLGYDRHNPSGRGTGNSRDGPQSKTVLAVVDLVEIDLPREQDASVELEVLAKRQNRLVGVDEILIPSAVRGLTTDEIFARITEAEVSFQAISTITDNVIESVVERQNWSGPRCRR
ncbi:hypothetical protein GCM10011609_84960 [Lentzea pudingi]|uniref:Mutator family transposase n=1 Tax=Lentzea pudingi TaxID=1789439 RepID=A0ABQ2IVB2_9PSEU|nr:transposase [Lentzea pudingi]GGN28652.1 hypothetical protein GCM10011609_84960 [Lentzea pudingi]